MAEPRYFIGILSGTSMDAVDCILADFSAERPVLVDHYSQPYPDDLRRKILELCTDKPVPLRQLGETDVNIARVFADAICSLLRKSGVLAEQVSAIGSHGQTVQHQPLSNPAFTLQLGDPNTVAALTGITTVGDFRRKDIAFGGQGAPLTPLFHQAYFAQPERQRVVLNLGGIANISILTCATNSTLRGFDTGPANVLMDVWINLNKGLRFDEDGGWAAQGRVNELLLSSLLLEPFLQAPAPKSTGRELFNAGWLETHLAVIPGIAPVDVQATLLEYTARTVCDGIRAAAPACAELIVCGGGVRNKALMRRLQEIMGTDVTVQSTDAYGLAADWVEAMAFAWIAEQTLEQQALDSTGVTGASRPCILGGIYHAEKRV